MLSFSYSLAQVLTIVTLILSESLRMQRTEADFDSPTELQDILHTSVTKSVLCVYCSTIHSLSCFNIEGKHHCNKYNLKESKADALQRPISNA